MKRKPKETGSGGVVQSTEPLTPGISRQPSLDQSGIEFLTGVWQKKSVLSLVPRTLLAVTARVPTDIDSQQLGCGRAAAVLSCQWQIWVLRPLLLTRQTNGWTDTLPLHRPCTAYYASSITKYDFIAILIGASLMQQLVHTLLLVWESLVKAFTKILFRACISGLLSSIYLSQVDCLQTPDLIIN